MMLSFRQLPAGRLFVIVYNNFIVIFIVLVGEYLGYDYSEYLKTPNKMQGHAVMHDTRRCNNKIQQIIADRETRLRVKHQSSLDTPPSTPPGRPSGNVRRCLFPDTINEKERQEYRQKVFEEIHKATEKVGKEKYNFDFANEVALEGNFYEWYKKVNGEWVYMEPKPVDLDATKTPLRETDNKSLPEIGKRKRSEGEIEHQAVKKRLHYD